MRTTIDRPGHRHRLARYLAHDRNETIRPVTAGLVRQLAEVLELPRSLTSRDRHDDLANFVLTGGQE